MNILRKPTDPYFYGRRWIERVGADGKKQFVVEPLTEYDVLHPREGDQISQNTAHNRDCRYLMGVAELRLAGREGAVSLNDCQVDLGLPDVEPLAPDLAALEGVRERRRWSVFSVREEGARWLLVGEVTSPSTRANDLNVKPDYYWRAGVPFFFIVDEVSARGAARELRLLAYERGRRNWRRVRPNAQGRVWLEALGVWLGIEEGRVVCYDAEGRSIEDILGMARARDEAEAARRKEEAARRKEEAARRKEEAARRKEEAARLAAEERVRQLEEELRRLREGG